MYIAILTRIMPATNGKTLLQVSGACLLLS